MPRPLRRSQQPDRSWGRTTDKILSEVSPAVKLDGERERVGKHFGDNPPNETGGVGLWGLEPWLSVRAGSPPGERMPAMPDGEGRVMREVLTPDVALQVMFLTRVASGLETLLIKWNHFPARLRAFDIPAVETPTCCATKAARSATIRPRTIPACSVLRASSRTCRGMLPVRPPVGWEDEGSFCRSTPSTTSLIVRQGPVTVSGADRCEERHGLIRTVRQPRPLAPTVASRRPSKRWALGDECQPNPKKRLNRQGAKEAEEGSVGRQNRNPAGEGFQNSPVSSRFPSSGLGVLCVLAVDISGSRPSQAMRS